MNQLLSVLLTVAPGSSLLAQDSPAPPEQAPTIAWADFDGDGLDDALMHDGGGPLRLLRNRGDGAFDDVARETGLGEVADTAFVSWQDVDADGDQDLLVGMRQGAPRLYLAQDGVFVEVGDVAGFDPATSEREPSWRDFDGDGRVDVTLGGTLYRNLGAGSFERVDLGLSGGGGPAGAPRTFGLPRGTSVDLVEFPYCAPAIEDQAGDCLYASSNPTLGMLYPLSEDFQISSTGHVGLGEPPLSLARMHVAGDTAYGVWARGQDYGLIGSGDVGTYGEGRVAVLGYGFEYGGLFYGTVALRDGLVMGAGATTSHPEGDLHIRQNRSVEVLLEADLYDSDESNHPTVRFRQDGGLVESVIGFGDGSNHLSLRNLYPQGGLRFDIHTSSDANWEFRRRASAGTDVEMRLTRAGSLQIDGTVSSPAADLAEFYPVVGEVEPADVVAFTGQGLALGRAAHADGPRLAGVISSRPAFTMGLSYTDEGEFGTPFQSAEAVPAPELESAFHRIDPAIEHEIQVNRRAPLALAGRVPVKISAENGRIRPGDRLTVAGTPGHAMLATEAGPVIGTALEPWAAGSGKILVFVDVGWHVPVEEMTRLREALDSLQAEVAELRKTR